MKNGIDPNSNLSIDRLANDGSTDSFWLSKLQNAEPTNLATDFPAASYNQYELQRVEQALSSDRVEKVQNFAAKHQIPKTVVWISLIKLMIFRWSSMTEVSVAAYSSDDSKSAVDNNDQESPAFLPVFSVFNGTERFSELLLSINQHYLEALENGPLTVERLDRFIKRDENLSYQFHKDIGLYIDNNQSAQTFRCQHPLAVRIVETNGLLKVVFEYDGSKFETISITRMVARYIQLLDQVVSQEDRLLTDYSILLQEERSLFATWNNTDFEFDNQLCLHQLFEQQVELTPERIALEFEQQSLTYHELNRQANKLAVFLTENGVTQEVTVGVCMERSFDLVISLYAILKAGGAYVPIDPDYPSHRLKYIVDDTETPLILTHSKLEGLFSEIDCRLINLDQRWSEIDTYSDQNLIASSSINNLAYVIYTSGSTGNPKGVMNQHDGIVNRLLWMQKTYQLTEKDCVLQKTPYSFDVSVWEFFWPLIVGSRLVIAKPKGHLDVDYLVETIAKKSVTSLHFVPSMLQLFLTQADPKCCESIRQVFCSGEALPYVLQNQFFNFSRAKLHNLYGPTEAAVDVTFWQCDSSYSKNIVPIGRPVSNTKIYVLDQAMRQVPIGTPGELHIGGVQVARGYLNRNDLTNEKFITDPFSDDITSRLYKTGDLVRYLNDGEIEYLGRIDFQVKIRGLRIELGEIEAQLLNISGVEHCVATVREDNSGDKRIVAYIQPSSAVNIDKFLVKQQLSLVLPEYMVPHILVILEQLPLSANGKVDRKKLPKPSNKDLNITEHYIAPETPVEIALSNIWKRYLAVERVSVYDKFIELGGHSLLALEVAQSFKDERGVELDPGWLIRDTLEQIAAKVEGPEALKCKRAALPSVIAFEPYYFGPNNELFGVYHPPTHQAEVKGAVLLCSPIYLESLNTHLTFRQLMTRLAASGYHVFRFDYYAAGDSLGDDEEASVDRWLSDIKSATKELQRRSEIKKLSVIGFRFGATLARHALPKSVDKLILWEPVVSGEAYAKQLESKYLQTLEQLNYIRKKPATPSQNEIIGFQMPESAQRSIESTQLISGEVIDCCERVIVVTANQNAEILGSQPQLADLAKNLEICEVNDSIVPIDFYTDLLVYLPGKSLNLIVEKMNE